MNDRQLTPINEALLDLGAMSKAAGTLQGLMKHLASDRVLLEGGVHRSGVTFAKIADTVIRVSSEVEKSPMIFNWAQNSIRYAPDKVNVSIVPATLAELLDAQRDLERNGNGEARIRVAKFIAYMRQESQPAGPMRIEIVNANELAPRSKIASVKRDASGKLSGMTVESVPDP